MTLNEIIYAVREKLNAYSDDDKISNENIAFLIKTKRNTFLKNYMSNLKKEIPLEAKQLICLTMVEDDNCEDDFVFLKSTLPIPATLETTGRSNIASAYLNSRIAKWINIIDYDRFPYLKSGRFNDKQIYFAIDPSNHLILYSRSGNHEFIEDVKLNIVAEDPEEADKLACKSEVQCDFYDKQFPMESSMVDPIINSTVNDLTFKYRIPSDNINNGEDDTLTNKLDLNNGRRNNY